MKFRRNTHITFPETSKPLNRPGRSHPNNTDTDVPEILQRKIYEKDSVNRKMKIADFQHQVL